MIAVADIDRIYEAVHRVKAGAPDFRTNFFPVPATLEAWIARGDLYSAAGDGAWFLLRKDRGFWRLYFCVRDPASLQRELTTVAALREEPLVVDVIGQDGTLDSLHAAVESAGFRRYARLVRLARTARPPDGAAVAARIGVAARADRHDLLDLIARCFDPILGQFPTEDEMAAATERGHVLTARMDGALAGLLFFQPQGLTSTVRYWLVAERFRRQHVGAALMRRYFTVQSGVRRFLLWVAADNQDALRRYTRYGYASEDLIDTIFVDKVASR